MRIAGLVVARSAKGAKPVGCAIEAVDVSAMVQAIDKKKRTAALKLPDGRLVTTKNGGHAILLLSRKK